MTIKLKDMKEFFEATDAEIDRESQELFGQNQLNHQTIPPRTLEIVKILQDKPILVQPCLQWLKGRLALLAQAELNVLYTSEQLEELRREHKIETKGA